MKTFQDVLDYLREHPRVSMLSPDSRVTFAEGAHLFHGVDRGLMWFKGPDGMMHHLPIGGMAEPESGVRVRPDGFDFAKLDVTICVRFLPDIPSAARPREEAAAPWAARELASDLAKGMDRSKPSDRG